jgi:acyl carrier protein
MSETTFEIVRRVLVNQLDVAEGEVRLEAVISDDLGADSLDALELIVALGEEFDLDIDAPDADALKTVGDVVELIDSLR